MFFSTLYNLQERAQWTELTLINYNLKGWQENLQIFLKIKWYIFADFIVNYDKCEINNEDACLEMSKWWTYDVMWRHNSPRPERVTDVKFLATTAKICAFVIKLNKSTNESGFTESRKNVKKNWKCKF